MMNSHNRLIRNRVMKMMTSNNRMMMDNRRRKSKKSKKKSPKTRIQRRTSIL